MLTLPTDGSYGNVMPSFVRQRKKGVTVLINTINILNQKDKKVVNKCIHSLIHKYIFISSAFPESYHPSLDSNGYQSRNWCSGSTSPISVPVLSTAIVRECHRRYQTYRCMNHSLQKNLVFFSCSILTVGESRHLLFSKPPTFPSLSN